MVRSAGRLATVAALLGGKTTAAAVDQVCADVAGLLPVDGIAVTVTARRAQATVGARAARRPPARRPVRRGHHRRHRWLCDDPCSLVCRVHGCVASRAAAAVRQSRCMPPGYRLVMAPPVVADYLRLRSESGLSPKTQEQAQAALPGGWAACHVVAEDSGDVVGMGRVLGDGGWYFHVVDMAVLPSHQRRGLGDMILTALLERIRHEAPPGASVNLLADPPGRRLYARHGFSDTAPGSIGMALTLGPC